MQDITMKRRSIEVEILRDSIDVGISRNMEALKE